MTGPLAARVAALLALSLGACAGGGGRDVVPESREVRVLDAGDPDPGSAGGYEYVARRPLAVVALAEARGLPPDLAHLAVDRLADALDACITEQGRSGALVPGAARVVAPILPGGGVGAPSVRVDPGAGVAQSAILCLVAPVRLLTFPPVDAGVRGIAVEALWGKLVARPAP